MDLNHIELPPSLVAGLYQKTLIEATSTHTKPQPVSTPETADSKKSGWQFSGNNKQNILIIVDAGERHITQPEKVWLLSMLSACLLSEEDVVIVNRKDHRSEDYKSLTDQFKSRIVFLFGIEPVSIGLPVSFPHFQVQKFSSLTFLYAPNLAELMQDKLLKSKLWLSLKRIFTL